MTRSLPLLLLALLAAACGGGTTAAGAGASGDLLGAWQLREGTGPGGAIDLRPGDRITLDVEEGRIGGTAACNSYGGSARVARGRLELADLAATEMACAERLMALEAAYLRALRGADRIERDGDELVLRGPSVELRFAAVPAVPEEALVGTRWVLDTLLTPPTAASVQGEATLRLDQSGALEGTTGCRRLSGAYVVRGGEVRLTHLQADGNTPLEECGAAEQDAHVLSVVGDGFTAAVNGDRLELTGRDGRGLVYRAR